MYIDTHEFLPGVKINGISFAKNWQSRPQIYHEFFTGTWGTHRTGRVWSYSIGARSSGKIFAAGGLGPAYVDTESYTLTSRRQIMLNAFLGTEIGDNVVVKAGYRHVSNGSGLLDRESGNMGEDFFMTAVGVQF